MPASMDKQKVMQPKPTLLVPTSTLSLAPPHPHLMQQLQHPQHPQTASLALPLNTTGRTFIPPMVPAMTAMPPRTGTCGPAGPFNPNPNPTGPPNPGLDGFSGQSNLVPCVQPPMMPTHTSAIPPARPPTASPAASTAASAAAAILTAHPMPPVTTMLTPAGLPPRAMPPPAARMPLTRVGPGSIPSDVSPALGTLPALGFGASGRPAGPPGASNPASATGLPAVAGLTAPSVPAQVPVSATLTSDETLLPDKPCYMITFDETGAQVPDPAPNYAKHVTAIPANSMLDEFFNQKCPSVVPTSEISWSTVIDEIDELRLRQFREARALFYASRTVVPKTDAIFPFHEPEDTFNSCIEALTAVSGIDSPELTLRSDPAMVYSWCVKACLQFGNDLRAERTDGGSGEDGGGASGGESAAKRPRLSKEASAEALQLLAKLNHLLG